jgi:hypothetical protein
MAKETKTEVSTLNQFFAVLHKDTDEKIVSVEPKIKVSVPGFFGKKEVWVDNPAFKPRTSRFFNGFVDLSDLFNRTRREYQHLSFYSTAEAAYEAAQEYVAKGWSIDYIGQAFKVKPALVVEADGDEEEDWS